jgi:hypothetical protein
MTQENQEGLELNGTHQLLIYAAADDMLDKNVKTIKNHKSFFLETSREVGVELKMEKTLAYGYVLTPEYTIK